MLSCAVFTFSDLTNDGEVYLSHETDGGRTLLPRPGCEALFDRFIAGLQDQGARDFALFPRMADGLYDCAEIIPT